MSWSRAVNRATTNPKAKPFRDRQVDVRAVACGSCGAEAGQPCVSANGNVRQGSSHDGRRRTALRLGLFR